MDMDWKPTTPQYPNYNPSPLRSRHPTQFPTGTYAAARLRSMIPPQVPPQEPIVNPYRSKTIPPHQFPLPTPFWLKKTVQPQEPVQKYRMKPIEPGYHPVHNPYGLKTTAPLQDPVHNTYRSKSTVPPTPPRDPYSFRRTVTAQHSTHNPYCDPYYVPGGWPEDLPNEPTNNFSLKRKRDEESTPAVKRACRTAVSNVNGVFAYIASYRIIQAVRRRFSRSAGRRTRSAVTPAQQNSIRYSRTDSHTQTAPTDNWYLEALRPKRKTPASRGLDGRTMDRPSSANKTPPAPTLAMQKLQAHIEQMNAWRTQSSRPSPPPQPRQNPLPPPKERSLFPRFAQLSTKQYPLPTPEPEDVIKKEPELLLKHELEAVSKEESKVVLKQEYKPAYLRALEPFLKQEPTPTIKTEPGIKQEYMLDTAKTYTLSGNLTASVFSNMPILRPVKPSHMMTPEYDQDPVPSIEESSLSIEQSLCSNKSQSNTEESTEADDSPSAQLREGLQSTFIQSDKSSDTGSDGYNPAWRGVRHKVTRKALHMAALAAKVKESPPAESTSPELTSPILTLPSFRDRSFSSLHSTPVKVDHDKSEIEPKDIEPIDIEPIDNEQVISPELEMSTSVIEEQAPATSQRNTTIIIDTPTTTAPEEDIANLTIQDESPSKVATPKAVFHAEERLRRLTRARALKEQAIHEALNQYEIVPLTDDWDEKVRTAVREGFGKYSASDLGRVVPQYASRGQDNWLNDESINGYLDIIVAHGKKSDRDGQVSSHHAFNSFFYKNLVDKGPQSVARWSKRAKIAGKDLMFVEKVFIPINNTAHWTLAVVEPTKKRITHYNSLSSGRTGATACEYVKKWVAMELGASFKEEEWTIETVGKSPQQTNSDDCGVFTITSARQIMLGFDPTSYQASQIQTQRKRIVAELVANALIKSKE